MLEMIPLETALDLLLKKSNCCSTEAVELSAAYRRVLAEEIVAATNQPPFNRSPLDGYALQGADLAGASHETPARLRVTETLQAGYVAKGKVEAGTAIRIMTGAPVPDGADTIIRFEDTKEENGWVEVYVELAPGSNIANAGEDIRQGELLLKPGSLLESPQIGVLAALGVPNVPVYKRPRVAILSTGDELIEIDQELRPGKIRNSNLYTLAASVRESGGEPILLGTCPDVLQITAEKISAGLNKADLVVTTGGASVGDYDLVQKAMKQVGAGILFWKIAMKPGTPVVAAEAGEKLLLGLSGNPAAALISFEVLVRPLIKKMAGFREFLRPRITVKLMDGFRKKSSQKRFLRATVKLVNGEPCAYLAGAQNPGVLKSLLYTNALLEVPGNRAPLMAGEMIEAIITGHLC